MLSKGHRIRKSKEFDKIREQGIKYKTPHFMVNIRRVPEVEINPEYKYPRFGFIVSKKIGGAVTRNKVKRWLREAVRLNLEAFPINIEAAIIAFEGAENSNFEELQSELKALLSEFTKG